MIDTNLTKNSPFGIFRNALKIDPNTYHTLLIWTFEKVWYCFRLILSVFRAIPNREFLIKFGSIIFDPLWGPTAELNGGVRGGRSPLSKKSPNCYQGPSIEYSENSRCAANENKTLAANSWVTTNSEYVTHINKRIVGRKKRRLGKDPGPHRTYNTSKAKTQEHLSCRKTKGACGKILGHEQNIICCKIEDHFACWKKLWWDRN